MRLIAGTRKGVQVLRWIKGERAASLRARALEAERILAATAHGPNLYVGTGSGKVFVSEDRGSSWKPMQEGLQCEAVCSLAAGTLPGSPLYAGTEPAALFGLEEDAERWDEVKSFRAMEATEEWRGYADRGAHVQTTQVDPHADKRLYAGVEVGGAYASEDRGRNWHVIGDGLYEDVHVLAVDPQRGSRVYAATGGGLYVSDNRGLAWQQHSGEVGTLYCTALLAQADRTGSTVLYVATAAATPAAWPRQGAQAALQVSRDGGASFAAATVGAGSPRKHPFTAITEDPEDTEAVFVGTGGGSVYHGTRCGEYWVRIHGGGERILTLIAI